MLCSTRFFNENGSSCQMFIPNTSRRWEHFNFLKPPEAREFPGSLNFYGHTMTFSWIAPRHRSIRCHPCRDHLHRFLRDGLEVWKSITVWLSLAVAISDFLQSPNVKSYPPHFFASTKSMSDIVFYIFNEMCVCLAPIDTYHIVKSHRKRPIHWTSLRYGCDQPSHGKWRTHSSTSGRFLRCGGIISMNIYQEDQLLLPSGNLT